MEYFRVTLKKNATIITNDAKSFIMKVEKDRQLTANDTGAIIEATLYKEVSTFIPECGYVFEVLDTSHNSTLGAVDTEMFQDAVSFFFHAILNTSYFVKSIPKGSTLYHIPKTTFEGTDDIQVSNLYNLLSGY